MKVLFLSHAPHEVHLEFAKAIGARIKILNLSWLVKLIKKIPFIGLFYPLFSLIYSFFIKVKEDIFLIDGGSSLYLATFLKIRYPQVKMVYLDGDMLFYNLNKRTKVIKLIYSFFFNKINAVISVSKQNKNIMKNYVNVPIEVSVPYPKKFKKLKIKKRNYGLYVGRLDPDKSIKRIIEFGLRCPFFEKFIIVGDGAYRNYVEKLTKKNKKLQYLGYLKNLDKVYSESKFLIHIPDYDPHPCTTMEAALGGCFPIVSKGVGTKYLFDDLFIVQNPEDFEEINRKIGYVLNNEDEANKLLNKSIKKFPTKGKAIKNFIKLFNKITKK